MVCEDIKRIVTVFKSSNGTIIEVGKRSLMLYYCYNELASHCHCLCEVCIYMYTAAFLYLQLYFFNSEHTYLEKKSSSLVKHIK